MKKIIMLLIILGLFFILFPVNIISASDNPLESNVVAYWALDGDSGNIIIDSSPNHYDGISYNMENEDWVSGKLNNCLVFDGVNEYARIDNLNCGDFERNQIFSVEAWINTSANHAQAIMSKWSPYEGWMFYLSSVGRVQFILAHTSTNRGFITGSVTVNDNTWHHIIITYTGTSNMNDVKIYVDGVLDIFSIIGDNTLTGSILNTNGCTIGSRNGVDLFFVGLIDEVVIYNKELTQSDVDYRYNDGIGRGYSVNILPNKPICVSPIDRKLNVDIDTTLKVEVVDVDNDTMNVSFYLDNVIFETIYNVTNNTIVESSNLSLDYSKMYDWYAIVEDKDNSVQSDTFIFATKSEPESIIPNFSPKKPVLIFPNNNSINVSKFTRLKSYVDDFDDDFLYVNFYWENNSEIQSLFSITNYTIQTSMLNLEYNTTYSWYVVVTDFIDYNISDIYTFTTESESLEDEDDYLPSEIELEIDYTILLIGICLAIIVFALEFYSNKLKIKRSNLLSAIELALLLLIISIMIFLKFI